jgi:hypothetical protein
VLRAFPAGRAGRHVPEAEPSSGKPPPHYSADRRAAAPALRIAAARPVTRIVDPPQYRVSHGAEATPVTDYGRCQLGGVNLTMYRHAPRADSLSRTPGCRCPFRRRDGDVACARQIRTGRGVASGTWVQAYRGVMTEDLAWIPEACTLPTAERPLRRAEFDEVFARAVSIERTTPSHARVQLVGRAGLAEQVADLAARENACCAFFTFTVTPLPSGDVTFDVEVPAGHIDVLNALVARAVGEAAR